MKTEIHFLACLSPLPSPPLPIYTHIYQPDYCQVLITKFVLFTRSNTVFQCENLYSSPFFILTLKSNKKKKGVGKKKQNSFCLLGVSSKPSGSIFGIPQINLWKMVSLKGRHMYPFCQLITDPPYEGKYSLLYRPPSM